MKKIIILMFVLLLISTTVFAANNEVKIKTQEQNMERLQGLENAMLQVKHSETVEHLGNVWEQINNKYREKIENLNDIEIEENSIGMIEFTGKKEAKLFGLFKMQHKVKYVSDELGNVVQKRNMFEWLWRDI